ncbi:MAG: ferrous iron transporter B, partial [Bacilli bacterium]
PIFLVILFLVFHLTFSENLFWFGGLFTANGVKPVFEGTMFEGLFWTQSGINSPGVILTNFLTNILDAISGAIATGLANAGAYSWAQGLIVDGVVGGLFAVLGFLPQILCLFLFFSILEDTGYMARVAFILDRIFRKFGLSGRAFMPMIMGFGCSLPAMINTRTLADEKEKIATIRVIPFFSCGAKLPILTAIAGGIVSKFGIGNADVITYSMYLVGMVTAIVTVIVMRNTSLRGKVPPFIMELPAYHAPKFSSLMIHLWDKVKGFVKKAFTIIFASTIVIWFLSNFGWDWRMCDMSESILASLGKLIQPLFTPLGFGVQLSEWGWVFAVAALTGLVAKENVIATFFSLATAVVATKFQFVSADFTQALAILGSEEIGGNLSVISEILKVAINGNTADSITALGKTLAEFELDANLISSITEALTNGNAQNAVNIYVASLEGVDAATSATISSGIADMLSQGTSILDYLDVIFATGQTESGVSEAVVMMDATGITVPGLLSFIAFNMTTIPCFSACATAKAELPKKAFWPTILFWVVTSFIVGSLIYCLGTVEFLPWSIPLFVILGGLMVAGIIIYNRKMNAKEKEAC